MEKLDEPDERDAVEPGVELGDVPGVELGDVPEVVPGVALRLEAVPVVDEALPADDGLDAVEDVGEPVPEGDPVEEEADDAGVEAGRVELEEDELAVLPGFAVELEPDVPDAPVVDPPAVELVELPVVEPPAAEPPDVEAPGVDPPGRLWPVVPEDGPPVVEAPGLGVLFSAVRSMVTGRLDALEDEDGLSGLPEAPFASEGDVPSEDFLSVAICSPPEPCRSQDFHYTHLFAERYHSSSDIPALQ